MKPSLYALFLCLTLTGCWNVADKELAPVTTPTAPVIDMVPVTGSTFDMGTTLYDKEMPVHKVKVDDFKIGKYEVTQQQWIAVMGSNPSARGNCLDCPVESVSWDDVQAFLVKINQRLPTGKAPYRLPTEAEWEYAAGGGNSLPRTRYGNGKNLADVTQINFKATTVTDQEVKDGLAVKGGDIGTTTKVGNFSPATNPLGLYDMSGNVWEWCNDWYGLYTTDGTTQMNPKGPATGTLHVLRGGSFIIAVTGARIAWRGTPEDKPNKDRQPDFGFRLASDK
ncbi:formylglycine-generating enzyme family protein [Fibrivirga algicola]|uniref:Formylglycine-generating enzyme family protein n=1 Tax=Fibrivirga algicola TaxID=2950420 RepID=A0ABX0QMW1_9BACT|nr:SUMF1/EgtB/PvdO family nonheme iron enzyme [Fibrivirga algicola]NID13841.1 formylglycine-generating enzyme family protein [Fibrivirga algicola]